MKTTIYQNQSGLLIREGVIVRELAPGLHKTRLFGHETIVSYPTSTQYVNVSVAATTGDAVTVTITLICAVQIVNVSDYHLASLSLSEILHVALSNILQRQVAALGFDELLQAPLAVEPDELAEAIAPYGITATLAVQPSLVLSRSLRSAIDAQEIAKQKAKADLEEARGRTAVVRHYANTARVVEQNPDVLRLLLGQKAKSINVAFDAPRGKS